MSSVQTNIRDYTNKDEFHLRGFNPWIGDI